MCESSRGYAGGSSARERPTDKGGRTVAELTKLESKLGEVTGLAMAAQGAASKVVTLAKEEHPELVSRLEQMKEEAAETERRCTELAGTFE